MTNNDIRSWYAFGSPGGPETEAIITMRDIKVLYERLRATPVPALARSIGDFGLYESLLAGCVDRVCEVVYSMHRRRHATLVLCLCGFNLGGLPSLRAVRNEGVHFRK